MMTLCDLCRSPELDAAKDACHSARIAAHEAANIAEEHLQRMRLEYHLVFDRLHREHPHPYTETHPKASEEFASWMKAPHAELIAELHRRGYGDFAAWCGANNARVNYALQLAELLVCGKCGHRPLLTILQSQSTLGPTPPPEKRA